MDYLFGLGEAIGNNWPIWIVTVTLIVAAVIDGFELKVPNKITFPMIISGWVYSTIFASSHGLMWYEGLVHSLLGTLVGLALLMPAYMIGGMGAGDVKLLAGVGAWVHATVTFYSFGVSTLVGALLAILMVLFRKAWSKHFNQFWLILNEVLTIRDPETLSTIAADRKSSMLLLPYGIPIAIGTISYFAWSGMLV